VQGSREVGVLHIRREDSRRDGERSLRDVLAGAGLAGAGSAGCQPGDAQAG